MKYYQLPILCHLDFSATTRYESEKNRIRKYSNQYSSSFDKNSYSESSVSSADKYLDWVSSLWLVWIASNRDWSAWFEFSTSFFKSRIRFRDFLILSPYSCVFFLIHFTVWRSLSRSLCVLVRAVSVLSALLLHILCADRSISFSEVSWMTCIAKSFDDLLDRFCDIMSINTGK